MKITIDIPEWAENSRIAVFAGMEQLAYYNKLSDPDNVFVKETRCNMCGKCCMFVKKRPMLNVVNGMCVYLHPERKYCTVASNRPLNCCYDPNIEFEYPECCITHKKVPIEK